MEEKTHPLTLFEQRMSVIHVAVELKVTRMAIYNSIKAAGAALSGAVPQDKEGSGYFSLNQHQSGRDLLSFNT